MGVIGLKKPKMQIVFNEPIVGEKVIYISEFETDKKLIYINFIRHIGCPFAEATIKNLILESQKYPNIEFFIVSHGDQISTEKLFRKIGDIGDIKWIYDEERELYGKWGLGYSTFIHFMGVKSLVGVFKLLFKGIRNRSASGTRWQKAGAFLINQNKEVIWKHVPESAEELPPSLEQILSLK